jgi:hypothetical protein
MAYMNMDQNTKNLIILCLFIFNVLLASLWLDLGPVVNIMGSTTMPFMIYILPGILYWKLSARDGDNRDKHGRYAKWFAIFGVI